MYIGLPVVISTVSYGEYQLLHYLLVNSCTLTMCEPRADIVTESFLLLVDPYHKQIYQQPVVNNATSVPEVRGVPVPDMDIPTSVDVDINGGILYWIDTSKRQIVSSDTTGNQFRVIYQASRGNSQRYTVLQGRVFLTYLIFLRQIISHVGARVASRIHFIIRHRRAVATKTIYSSAARLLKLRHVDLG